MTREEAISVLKNTAWIGTDKKVGEVEKAIMMAVDALKAQIDKDIDVPNITDCISRQDAIDAVKHAWAKGLEPTQYIEDLPSVQPNLDRVRVSDLMERIYSIQSAHLSVEGVLARKYFCEIISGLQMTMDLIQFDPGTGNVRPIYTLNDLDKTTYVACKAAIKALKAQIATDTNVGSNDLISRRDAIDVVKKNTFRLTFAEEQNCEGHVAWSAEAVYSEVMEGALLELPSAQPERRWIPCNERLPEEYGNYLVSFQIDDEPDIGTYNPDTTKWSACDSNGFYWVTSKGLEVIAWMPLPEPYREEGD